MAKIAVLKEIQVGGGKIVNSLEDACKEYLRMIQDPDFAPRTKILFAIVLPDGEVRQITIRDEEEDRTVAYGDFEGLPSFLDYSKEVLGKEEER